MNLIINGVFVVILDLLVAISRVLTSGNNNSILMNDFIVFNTSVNHKRKQFEFEFKRSDFNDKIDMNFVIKRKAFAAGVDVDGQTLFICRVRVFNELIPGKYSSHLNKCSVTYNNRELQYNKYQLLIESQFGSYNWTQVRRPVRHLPANIVLGGVTITGQFYYICQCRLRSQQISRISEQIGKVYYNQSVQQWMATVPFSGQEVQCLDYSVLIMP